MDKTTATQQTAVAGQEPTPEPVITPYQKAAAEIGADFETLLARIPGYNDDLSGIPKRVRRPVTAKFIGMSVAAVEAVTELQGVKQLDPADYRNTGPRGPRFLFMQVAGQLAGNQFHAERSLKAKA